MESLRLIKKLEIMIPEEAEYYLNKIRQIVEKEENRPLTPDNAVRFPKEIWDIIISFSPLCKKKPLIRDSNTWIRYTRCAIFEIITQNGLNIKKMTWLIWRFLKNRSMQLDWNNPWTSKGFIGYTKKWMITKPEYMKHFQRAYIIWVTKQYVTKKRFALIFKLNKEFKLIYFNNNSFWYWNTISKTGECGGCLRKYCKSPLISPHGSHRGFPCRKALEHKIKGSRYPPVFNQLKNIETSKTFDAVVTKIIKWRTMSVHDEGNGNGHSRICYECTELKWTENENILCDIHR